MAAYAWFVIMQPGSGDGGAALRILVQSGLAALLVGPIKCGAASLGMRAAGWF